MEGAARSSDPLVVVAGADLALNRGAVVGAAEAPEHGPHHRPGDGGAHSEGEALSNGPSCEK